MFALNFILSWLFLGVIWFLIAYAHGDIDYFQKYDEATDKEQFEKSTNHTVCVTEIKSFLSAFLFSLETQHTIGKSFHHNNEQPIKTKKHKKSIRDERETLTRALLIIMII